MLIRRVFGALLPAVAMLTFGAVAADAAVTDEELVANATQCYMDEGSGQDLIDACTVAIDNESRWVEAKVANETGIQKVMQIMRYNRGYQYKKADAFDSALEDLSKAIELDPTCAPCYFERGWVHHYLELTRKAKADYKKAAELAPDDADYARFLKDYKG
jgi:tetratricopeptide (TPR) repeat protein